MTKRFKFLSVDQSEIDKKHGNFPIQYFVPTGPEHLDESRAEEWLKDNAEVHKKYILVPVYSS